MNMESLRKKSVQKDILSQKIGKATAEELTEIHKKVMWHMLGNEPDLDTKVSTDEKIKAINHRAKELGISL
ncbi:MAG: hypothetical protein AUK58_02980 [Candidatus Moranbacteria bacterium CG2_30_41_165]|nr:MAG: hypothetical protein AUK58_02980 [Candidatus Moranbacteria bacterium CG2_30_41_165]